MSICSSPISESPAQATQTSVRQMTPRLVDNAGPSSSKISIRREVSVASSHSLPPSRSSPILGHASTTSNTGSRNRLAYSAIVPRSDQAHLLYPSASKMTQNLGMGSSGSAKTTARLEKDRESVRELASFLANNEPPPSNRMSESVSNEPSNNCLKVPLNILNKLNRKKSGSAPRLLRLPDSAVAAKTSKGTLHIAISIPLEYDHMEHLSKPGKPLPPLPAAQRSSLPAPRRGPITVLKPITEEAARHGPTKTASTSDINNSNVTFPNSSVRTAASDPLLKMEPKDRREEKPEPNVVPHIDPLDDLKRNTFVAVSPITVSRQSSQRTDPRHSGGTAYSEKSWDTDTGNSKGPSSVTTAPSAKPSQTLRGITIEPPRRGSSVSKRIDLSSEKPLSHAVEPVTKSAPNDPIQPPSPPYSKNGHLDPLSSSNLNIANGQYKKGTAEVIVRIRSAPRTPAPTRALPELPEGGDDGRFVRSRRVSSGPQRAAKMTSKSRDSSMDALNLRCQTRQERVKALKMRDIAALKARQHGKQSLVHKSSQIMEHECIPISKTRTPGTSPRQLKRRSQSGSVPNESPRRRVSSVISPIMLVADLEPYPNIYSTADFVFPAPPTSHRKASSRMVNDMQGSRTHMPARAVTPSLASSDDESFFSPRHHPRRISIGQSRAVTYGEDRSPRRGRHEMTLQERDLENRLRRIEDTHAMMLETLEAVGLGFKELNRLMSLNMLTSDSPFRRSLTGGTERGMESLEVR